jgi:DNA-binding transcriptional regulator YiaG
MPKKYSELREELAGRVGDERLQQARRDADEEVERYERTLRQLRLALDLTQTELARRLDSSQAEVSRLERREDMLLSTLSRYVTAVGGRLEVNAVFPDVDVVVALHIGNEVGPIADPAPGALERLSETLDSVVQGGADDSDNRGSGSCLADGYLSGSFGRHTKTTATDDDNVDLSELWAALSDETLTRIRVFLSAFPAYPYAAPTSLLFAPIIAAIPARQPLPIRAHAIRLAKRWGNASGDSTDALWCGIAVPTAMRAGLDDQPPEIDWRSHDDPDETFTARLDDVELIACSD